MNNLGTRHLSLTNTHSHTHSFALSHLFTHTHTFTSRSTHTPTFSLSFSLCNNCLRISSILVTLWKETLLTSEVKPLFWIPTLTQRSLKLVLFDILVQHIKRAPRQCWRLCGLESDDNSIGPGFKCGRSFYSKKAFIGISAHLPHRHMRQSFLNGPFRPLFLYFHLFWVAIDRYFYVWIRFEVQLIPMSAMYNFQNKMNIHIHFSWYFARKNPVWFIDTTFWLVLAYREPFSLSCSPKKWK